MNRHSLLMIDDDSFFLTAYTQLLSHDYNISTASGAEEGLKMLGSQIPDLLLLDISMKTEKEGLEILPLLKEKYPALPIVIITNWDSHLIFKEAMWLGADDFFIKSDNLEYLKIILQNQLNLSALSQSKSERSNLNHPIAHSPQMQAVLTESKKVAQAHCPVLIYGETGVGKEIIAQFIHHKSRRNSGPFVAVNCAATPDTLVESEMFGYERGAFTGATRSRIGKFEAANNGTLFLDELEDLSLHAQASLLRATQEMQIEHIGSSKTIPVNVRIISATQHNLKDLVSHNNFRDDLYFRLAVFTIHVPPLRERRADIIPLADYFLKSYCNEANIQQKRMTDQTLRLLKNYNWPGNVRHLKNVIATAVIRSRSNEIRPGDLSMDLPMNNSNIGYKASKLAALREFKKEYISAALARHKGNISKTAEEVGISRQGLQKLIQKNNLGK